MFLRHWPWGKEDQEVLTDGNKQGEPKFAPALLGRGASCSWRLWLCSPLSTSFGLRTLACTAQGGPGQLQVTHDPVLPVATGPVSLSSTFPQEKSVRPHSCLWAGPHHACHSVRCPNPLPNQLGLWTEHNCPHHQLPWSGQSHLAKSVRPSRIPHKEGAEKKSRRVPSSWKR